MKLKKTRYTVHRRAREAEAIHVAKMVLDSAIADALVREEEEIRELRRRAVPKANELPEWYQFAPKRSQDARK